MTATTFPATSDNFFSISADPHMDQDVPEGKATEIITHLQNALRAVQDELRLGLAARWESVDMYTQAVAANTILSGSSAINGGTITNAPDASDYSGAHPGILRVRSGASASAGFRFATGQSVVGAAGLSYRTVFAPKTSVASSTLYLGIHNGGASTAEPASGCYLAVSPGGSAVFKAATNGSRTTAPGSTSLVPGVWYTCDISWLTATSARCVLRNDSGVVLFDTNVAVNVPNSPSWLLWPAWSGFNSSSNADVAILDLIAFGPVRPAHVALP
jgi:hypothetical protein